MKKPLTFRKSIDSLLDLKNSKFKKFKKNNKLNYTSIMIMEHAIKLPLYSNIEAYISGKKQNNVIKNINNNARSECVRVVPTPSQVGMPLCA